LADVMAALSSLNTTSMNTAARLSAMDTQATTRMDALDTRLSGMETKQDASTAAMNARLLRNLKLVFRQLNRDLARVVWRRRTRTAAMLHHLPSLSRQLSLVVVHCRQVHRVPGSPCRLRLPLRLPFRQAARRLALFKAPVIHGGHTGGSKLVSNRRNSRQHHMHTTTRTRARFLKLGLL
jgi:hypothetical protein